MLKGILFFFIHTVVLNWDFLLPSHFQTSPETKQMWIHLPTEKPHLSNTTTIDFSTHAVVGSSVYNSEVLPWKHFIPKVQMSLAISFNLWSPFLVSFSGGQQQRGQLMSSPVSCSFSIELLFHSHLLNCQIDPFNPSLALHSCSLVGLFSTESQPAVGMQGCFGQSDCFLLLFALGFPQHSESCASVNIYTAVSILCPGLFSADM